LIDRIQHASPQPCIVRHTDLVVGGWEAPVAEVRHELAGEVEGRRVDRFTLSNERGLRVEILPWGATIQSVWAPDRAGTWANVALGFADLEAYATRNVPFFGCVAGRYANRIAGGSFTLDGETFYLPTNAGTVTLHGGVRGFDKRLWEAEGIADGVRLTRGSPDGEEGFPGNLTTEISYRLDDVNRLCVDYRAETDRPTVVNLTNHSYWNLGGEGAGSADSHLLRLNASRYTPVDANQIPTGELAPVHGTPLDFTSPAAFGERSRMDHPQLLLGMGIDHNFVLDREVGDDSMLEAAVLHDPGCGRTLTVWTTEPGIQVYGGNYLNGTIVGASGRTYRQGDGIALETQHFPNSPNEPSFPSTVLRPGETFASTTVFAFSVTDSL
jgi:aldose 1-epimerase